MKVSPLVALGVLLAAISASAGALYITEELRVAEKRAEAVFQANQGAEIPAEGAAEEEKPASLTPTALKSALLPNPHAMDGGIDGCQITHTLVSPVELRKSQEEVVICANTTFEGAPYTRCVRFDHRNTKPQTVQIGPFPCVEPKTVTIDFGIQRLITVEDDGSGDDGEEYLIEPAKRRAVRP